ncbi:MULTISPECIES: CGNR zinc finger domain-containing protein [unclassified Kitasatospora]|uniref:CGNR zinc finger domain-containing protein n=1 Tax=unclassified Kitasatospora TaxID=2633591 RepID=UPI000A99ACC1|nr:MULTISPECIES: CGNR zinc finger domain-containing protein [unclassified Kitasatospora]
MTIEAWRITGQPDLDSHIGWRVELAAHLVNCLTATSAHGRPVTPPSGGDDRLAALTDQLAAVGRVPSLLTADEADRMAAAGRPPLSLTDADADRLAEVAAELRPSFGAGDRILGAAARLNQLLVRHNAVPNLHGDPHRPLVLSFHRADADLVDAWAADTGTALAMVIGVGQAARLGACQADECSLVFFDTTRNASRRFCDLACQNRTKASAYRARRRAQSS